MAETVDDTESGTIALTSPAPPAPTIMGYTLPSAGVQGTTIIPRVTLRNNSPTQPAIVTVVVSGTHTTSGRVLTSSGVNVSIPPGTTACISCPIGISGSADLGTYRLIPAVYWSSEYPSGGRIAIGSAKDINISSPAPPAPPAKGEFRSVEVPASVEKGTAFTICTTIKNTGGLSGMFKIQAYLNGAIKGTGLAFPLAAGAISGLMSFKLTAPTSGTSMTYAIKCIRIT